MINFRRCFACQLHCNYIESGLQVHEVLLTEIMFTKYPQFLIFLQLLTKTGEVRFCFCTFFLRKIQDIPCVPQQCQSHQFWSGNYVLQCCITALSKNHRQSLPLFFMCAAVPLSKQIILYWFEPERTPVYWRQSMLDNCCPVLPGGISLVTLKAPLRILFPKFNHLPVPRHFRQNRSRGNTFGKTISFHYRLTLDVRDGITITVNQQIIRSRLNFS